MTTALGRLGHLRLGALDSATTLIPEPPASPSPLSVWLGGTDVTARILKGTFSWESAIGRTPTCSFQMDGGSIAAGAAPWQGTYPVPVVRVLWDSTVLFLGPATSYERGDVDRGLVTSVSAFGWQDLAEGCPAWPNHYTAAREWDPDGHTWDMAAPAAGAVEVLGFADVPASVEELWAWWRGPAVTLDVDTTLVPEWTDYAVRGDSIASVMDGILARCGGGAWWLDGAMVVRARYIPDGVGGGEATYTGPVGLLADWSLGNVPDTDVIVPVSVSESGAVKPMIAAAWGQGKIATADAYVQTGDPWGPATTVSVASSRPSVVRSYARRELRTGGWDVSLSAVIPPLVAGTPVPEIGKVVHLEYGYVWDEGTETYVPAWDGYYLVRGITAQAVTTGDDLDTLEWTLDLGTRPPRSYAREAPGEFEAAKTEQGFVYPKQVKNVEVSDVNQTMDVGTQDLVSASCVDGNRNRVAMDAGRIVWTLVIDDVEVGIGGPDAEFGWQLQTASSAVEFTDANPMGSAFNVITRHPLTIPHPIVAVRAYYEEATD